MMPERLSLEADTYIYCGDEFYIFYVFLHYVTIKTNDLLQDTLSTETAVAHGVTLR